jgi:metallo-beta-lactamase family protein
MISVTICGAAGGEVTGSGYLVRTPRATVLVDFGMFQGRGAGDERNRDLGPVDPAALDAVVVTHAHLDHTGRLPLLTRGGYAGPIFATPATIDFARLILQDSGKIQEGDTRRLNQERAEQGLPPLEPIYTHDDVEALAPLGRPVAYDEPTEVAPGVSVRLVDAGHILGSASVEMTVDNAGATRTIVFSGDVGRWDAPILRDPTPLDRADLVFLESTYGDRDHRSFEATAEEFQATLKESIWQKQKILIPAFAVGRSQQILYYIAEAIREGLLPEFPIYLDSPMAIKATQLHRKHQDLFDEEAARLTQKRQLREDLRSLRMLMSAEESRALNDEQEACVIIAGAGMCDGGRIQHHLLHNLWRRHVSVLLVGYMAERSLGRRLVERDPVVEIFGKPVDVRATVRTLGGFSGHAGQSELLRWMEPLAASGPRVVLTHGEDRQRGALADALHERLGLGATRPAIGETIELS